MNARNRITEPEAVTTVTGEFPDTRYGDTRAIVQAVGAFVGLFLFTAYVIIDASHLMSNNCFDATGQIVCPISGPDWARPLPGAVALIGLLVGLAGLAVGRPVRAGALIAGFVLTAASLGGSLLIG